MSSDASIAAEPLTARPPSTTCHTALTDRRLQAKLQNHFGADSGVGEYFQQNGVINTSIDK